MLCPKADAIFAQKRTTFLEGNEISYSDCVLAAKLHHIRVAGAFYHGLQIPQNLPGLWSYLRSIYATKAFEVSCPLDRDIVLHYMERVEFVTPEAKKQAHHAALQLPDNQRSMLLPSDDRDALEVTQIPSSGLSRLLVTSVMQLRDYDRRTADRLSRLSATIDED